MNIYKLPVIDEIYELEDAIKAQYDVKVDIQSLFFPECGNDCYERIDFAEDEDEEVLYSWDDPEEITQRNLVRGYLRDILPGETVLLVWVSY